MLHLGGGQVQPGRDAVHGGQRHAYRLPRHARGEDPGEHGHSRGELSCTR